MRCTFHVDGDPASTWTEERDDLPLYPGDTVVQRDAAYKIIEGPHYEADWESASITTSCMVTLAKPVGEPHSRSTLGASPTE